MGGGGAIEVRYFSDNPLHFDATRRRVYVDAASCRVSRKESKMATKAIKVQVDERLAGEIADKAVKAWHATNYSNGKRRVYVTFEEVKTVGA